MSDSQIDYLVVLAIVGFACLMGMLYWIAALVYDIRDLVNRIDETLHADKKPGPKTIWASLPPGDKGNINQ